jgi:hypothetical protein
MRRRLISLLVFGLMPGFSASLSAQELACTPQRPTANRSSIYDSTTIVIGGKRALLCYGRPAARGRTMIGGAAVPYGKLWRTGANEPTTLHIPFPATVAGVKVDPGSYSIYTIPGEKAWQVIVNRSTSQWGHEGRYTPEVKAQEVGHGTVPSSRLKDPVEVFTITSKPTAAGADLVLEWEHTRVAIPVRAAK